MTAEELYIFCMRQAAKRVKFHGGCAFAQSEAAKFVRLNLYNNSTKAHAIQSGYEQGMKAARQFDWI